MAHLTLLSFTTLSLKEGVGRGGCYISSSPPFHPLTVGQIVTILSYLYSFVRVNVLNMNWVDKINFDYTILESQ